jgi:hypothetical protein
MAAVTPVPFAIAIILAVGAFVALTWYLVQDSRRPVDWSALDARAQAQAAAQARPHLSHTRIAAVCVVFTLWWLWATARPVSGWR